jgi:hypothetical protein
MTKKEIITAEAMVMKKDHLIIITDDKITKKFNAGDEWEDFTDEYWYDEVRTIEDKRVTTEGGGFGIYFSDMSYDDMTAIFIVDECEGKIIKAFYF